MIEDLIKSELEYFKPMLERQKLVNDEIRQVWRNETVAQRIERISLETYDLCDGFVCYGLFEGLRLNRETWWGRDDLGSQCLGLYEKEILDLIASRGPFDVFWDIGAADGYYAIGMLHSRMAQKVVCFEVAKKGQLAIYHNWLANNSTGELEINGEANRMSIAKCAVDIPSKALVMIDIEGFEFSLLTTEVISLFRNCEVVIEVHNWVENFPSKYQKLLLDLDPYFEITPIERKNRNTESISLLRSFTDDNRLLVTSERRPCLMRFLHLVPRKLRGP
jgi:hypothetical protein